MDYEDHLYFDWKSSDDITLNLKFNAAKFLWYTNVRAPVTFSFMPGKLEVIYRNFLLEFKKSGVAIYSDYNPRTFGKKAPESQTSLDITEEQANTIWRGIEHLLKTHPSKKIGPRKFKFDPFVLKRMM